MQAVQANIIAAQAVQAMLIRAPVSLRQESCAGKPRVGICDPAAVTALAQGSKAFLSADRSKLGESITMEKLSQLDELSPNLHSADGPSLPVQVQEA